MPHKKSAVVEKNKSTIAEATNGKMKYAETDYKSLLTNEQLIIAFKTMLLARTIDEKEMNLLKQGKVLFHISGPGHEAVQVAGKRWRTSSRKRRLISKMISTCRGRSFCIRRNGQVSSASGISVWLV